ncbi:10349_t:CDS:10 [Paraglomus brasilianum]|uniref:Vacuolar protein sorting-associated protein n=1 Tax=Paraglomus brasilianum TaxID=144538 RepID=A0A9N9FQU1_9GLOM|nr:10349_t:CDS:10 [Paraglomus brasilianum]
MLESLVANVLNRVLGAYVSNLENNQLNIAIWSGDVVLKNLQLKKEALDKFDLPVDVLEGYLGELTLNIPWANLRNKPVRAIVKDVYLLAVPKAESEYDPVEEERRAQQLKQEKLANAELLAAKPSEDGDDDKNQSFVNSLVTKVVDNLQISIKNIHIRYEDRLSDPGHPFAIGVTLSELSVVSADENWVPTFIEGETKDIRKLLTLGSLAVYWNTDTKSLAGHASNEAIKLFNSLIASESNTIDHQYILKPVSGKGRLTMSKRHDPNVPKINSTLLFDELGFVLDDEQYRDALLMVDLFHFFLRQQQYRKFRPPKEVTPKSNPRAWFQFAGKCILSEIQERNRKFTWAYLAERRLQRIEYLDLYTKKMLDRLTPEDTAKLEQLETKLSYEDIRFYRSIGRSRLRKEKALIAKKREIEKQHQRGRSGWLSGWWPGGGSSSDDTETILTDEQRKELYDAIEYDETAAVTDAVEVPKDSIQLQFSTILKIGSFALKKNPHGKNHTILSLVFDTVTTEFLQRPTSFALETALGSLAVYDGSTEGTLYPQIVRVKEDLRAGKAIEEAQATSVITEHLIKPEEGHVTENPFFQLMFESKPIDNRADNAFSLKMKHLEIIYNKNAIEAVQDFFKPPEQQMESIAVLIEAAGDRFEGIKAQTRATLGSAFGYAFEDHKTMDVEIDMNAPIVIIPESCIRKDAEVIVLDAGRISVVSNLVPKEVIAEIKSKTVETYSDKDLETLMYDRFSVELSSTQLLVGHSAESCLAQIRNVSTTYDLHVIDRININFLVELSILPSAPNVARIRVSGKLPLLQVNLSDRKYKTIMKIVDLVTKKEDQAGEDIIGYKENKKASSPGSGKGTISGKSSVRGNEAKKSWELAKHRNSMAISEKFGLGRGLADLLIDSESDGEGENKAEDNTDEFFDAVESEIPQSAKLHQRLFEFKFEVEKVSAYLKKSDKDYEKPETVLADMLLEHFALSFILRPVEISAEVTLESFIIEDKITETGSEFKHIVSSKGGEADGKSDGGNLVHVKYTKVDPQHPEYMSRFEGIDQSVDVVLRTITIVVTRKSILTLLDFVLDTFTTPNNSPAVSTPTNTESQDIQKQRKPRKQASTMRVKVQMSSIVFILNNDGTRLATGSLERADVAVMLRKDTLRVGARLGNFSLLDDTNSSPDVDSFRRLLTIQDEDLADFRYETFDESEPGYPGYDSSVYLHAGSARLTFLEEPVRLLVEFGSKFAQMKGLYDSARRAAVEQAAQLQKEVQKFHFDIVIRSPNVEFPRCMSKDSVVANLGEFSALNEFVNNSDGSGYLTRITAGIKDIRLTSNFFSDSGNEQELQIIDDVDIAFKVQYSQHVEGSNRPDMEITGHMSDVKMKLTEKQYKVLFELSNSFARAFSGGEAVEDSNRPSISARDGTVESMPVPSSPVVVPLTVAAPSDNPEPKLSVTFNVNQIYLEIFNSDESQADSSDRKSLSKFSLNKTDFRCKILTDGAIDAELRLQSVTLSDTRPNIKNVFREILPAINKDEPQFLVSLNMSGDAERNIIALVTIDSPKVIFALDYLFALKDFFLSPFVSDNNSSTQHKQILDSPEETAPTPPSKPSRPSNQSTSSAPRSTTLSYRVNLKSAEIILLANPQIESTEAVVLSANQIVVTQQSIMALSIDEIGMFLCRMDKRDATLLRFIDNFRVSLTVDNNPSTEYSRSTSIMIDVGPLIMRMSYRDVMLLMSILNKISELSSQSSSAKNKEVTDEKEGMLNFDYNNIQNTIKEKEKEWKEKERKVELVRESLKAGFQGLKLILIGDEHNIPMIDMNAKGFTVNVNDWSSKMTVDSVLETYINYFNLTNSHWEPLIEPWHYKLQVSKNLNPESMEIEIFSKKRLEINITHIFIETMLTTLSIFKREKEHVLSTARESRTPYKLVNRTGYSMHVWKISSDDNTDTEIRILEDGGEVNWRFDDWRIERESLPSPSSTKNMLGLQFEGSNWESIKDIPVDREGETFYILRPKLRDVSHRLVVDIKLNDNIKVVTFRSALVVENRTMLNVEMMIVDANGKQVSDIYHIGPNDDCPVPFESSYHHRLKFRPEGGFGYDWSSQSLYWQDFIKKDTIKSISCASTGEDVPFRFQIFAKYKKNDPRTMTYPCMSIRLSAPIEIENLLPYDVKFRVYDKTTKHDWPNNSLSKGGSTALHLIELGHLLLLSIEISDTEYKPSEFAIISSPNEDYHVDSTLTVEDPEGLKLNLKIHYTEIPNSGGAFKFSIYSPHVMMNKTGLDMTFKSKSLFQNAKIAAGQGWLSGRRRNQTVKPYMFSYPSDETRNRALLKVGDSDWSNPLSFEAVGSVMEVVIPSQSRDDEIHIGVSIEEGHSKYKLIKVVTFTPRFILKNNLNEDIDFRDVYSNNTILLKSKDRAPLHFLHRGDVKQLCFSYAGNGNPWSAPININDIGRIHLKVAKADREIHLLRIEILLEQATVFLILNKEEGKWPYRIDNYSDVDVVFYQQTPDRRESGSSASLYALKKYGLPAGSSEVYSWDFPALKEKRLILNVNGTERTVNIQEIGTLVPFKVPRPDGVRILSLEVAADGPTQVLLLSNYKQSKSMYKPRPASVASVAKSENGSAKDAFEIIDVDSVTSLNFQIRLEGIGISVINKRMQELSYILLRGLEFSYSDSTLYQSLNFVVKWLQIDNQLYGGLYPIIFYPTVIPKEGKEIEAHPTFNATLIKSKDESHGVVYFKYFSMLLQEMTFEMDEDFLFALLEFMKLRGLTTEEEDDLQLFDGNMDVPEPKSMEGDAQYYSEIMHIQPMKINISFVRTERVNVEDKPPPRNPITFFFNILTMAIGNINDAPIKLNALAMENVRVSLPVLIDRIRRHYGQEFLYQIHKIIGSADFLGNPVGLFTNISSGVMDVFYEPYHGVVMSGPNELGFGIARGGLSFVKKTVYGLSDSVAKFTGSIGKGLSAATLDKSYQDSRRMAQFRNRPKHALYGITQGANALATSVGSGIEGLVRKPIEGAEKEGATGLLKGVGKGLVGFVTKPVVGVFDLASNVTAGIRNTTVVFDEGELTPVRPPRFVGRDGILKPYNCREAVGQRMLKELENGKYFNDDYLAHIELKGDDTIAMLTRSRIMLIRSRRLKVEWEVQFSDLQAVSMQPSGILLMLRNGTPGPFIPIADQNVQHWFERKVEEVINEFNSEKRLAEC